MSNYFSKKIVSVASDKRNKIDLSSRVITSHDFGFCLPIFCRATIPGDKFKMNVSCFARMANMPGFRID